MPGAPNFVQSLTLTRPDDAHLHLRDGAALASVLPHTARVFARAVVMPNLRPPITDTALAAAYRGRVLKALPKGSDFEPLMTLYLTDGTSAEEIARAKKSGLVCGVKYYPAGATTNSGAGVTSIEHAYPALDAMQEHDLPLLVHGEVTIPGVDVFDRERVFLETVLADIARRFPRLRIVVEHVTTREAVVRAATSGNPKFFLGTDSAPHARADKETPCGHAGIYTAHAAIELYAEVFERAGALDKLEAFASFHAADFYRLPHNT